MKCPLCNREFFIESQLVGPYVIFHPPTKHAPEGGEVTVCGQCYLLVSILDTLKEIRDGKLR